MRPALPFLLALCLTLPLAAQESNTADPTDLDTLLGLPGSGASAPDDPEPTPTPTNAGPAALLDAVLARLQTITTRLTDDRDPGLTTQREQQRVLDELDQLIAAAEQMQQDQQQQQQSSSSAAGASGQPQPSQPQPQPANQPGQQQPGQPQPGQPQPGPNDPAQPQPGNPETTNNPDGAAGTPRELPGQRTPLEELRAGWGTLPPRFRDELLQGQSRTVAAPYRRATEAYFQRLAELATQD